MMAIYIAMYLIITVILVDITFACVPNCTCNKLLRLITLSCAKKNLKHFPTGIDRTTQFLRLEGNEIESIPYNLSQLLPDLQRIDLSDNKVTRLRSRIFAGLKNLKAVNLVNNKIVTIEDHIFEGSESAMMSLLLRGNDIKEIDENAFSGLYANSRMDLRDNSLTRLYPNTLNGIRLLTLNLANNHIVRLPDKLFQNQEHLYFLELKENNISTLNEQTFRDLSSLETLDMSSNKLQEIPDNTFERNLMLKTLELDHNNISSLSDQTFRNLSALETLDMSSNKLTEIPDNAFGANKMLKKLNLDTNQFQSPPVNVPSNVIIIMKHNPIVCDCKLKHLLFNNNHFNSLICVNNTGTVQQTLNKMNCETTTPPPTTTTPVPTTNMTSTSTSSTTNATSMPPTTSVTSTKGYNTVVLNTSAKTLGGIVKPTPTTVVITTVPGVTNRWSLILASSMVTLTVLVIIGVFCYIQRHDIRNKLCRPFSYYDVQRRAHYNEENLCDNVNDDFQYLSYAGWDNRVTPAFVKIEGNT